MSGKVPPSSKARARVATFSAARSPDARKAAARYTRFTGHDAENIGHVEVPATPRTLLVIGRCDAVSYTTVRDGVTESYIHEFRAKSAPMLCSSPDGRALYLVAGNYLFGPRGIVDKP